MKWVEFYVEFPVCRPSFDCSLLHSVTVLTHIRAISHQNLWLSASMAARKLQYQDQRECHDFGWAMISAITVTLKHRQCFFVTVRAGTAYRKIWRLVNNFFARIIRFTVQKFQLFWVIFCMVIFVIELWHILILWLAKMPNGGMPVFTLIATGWRYRKIFFYKKSTEHRHDYWQTMYKTKQCTRPIT